MNFIPFDPRTGGLLRYSQEVNIHSPKTIVHIPDNISFSKIDIPILVEKEEPDYSPDETLLTIGKEKISVFTFYCDSVSGGKDFSGNGTKERPFRNLQYLFETLLCHNELLPFLYSLKWSIRICLKGVVDYKVDYLSFYFIQTKFKHKWLIISKWEEEGDPEALIQLDMSSFYKNYALMNIHFQNIHFQGIKEVRAYFCFFEGCTFTHTKELPDSSTNDFYNCDITFELDYPWWSGRNFKECTMHFLPQAPDAHPGYEINCDNMEGCHIVFEDEYIIYRLAQLPYDDKAACFAFEGNCRKSDFSFALREPPTDHEFPWSNGASNLSIMQLCGVLTDCKITAEVEHHFAPLPENADPDTPWLNHLYVRALYGTDSCDNAAIRCHVENRGIYGENAKGVFCGSYGDKIKLIDCTASPSNDVSGNCIL